MSFDAINWATKQRVGNATAKHALLWLAFHANGRSGECFPSVELLMEEMEVGSKNTVKAALKTLIDAGLISSKREMKGNRVSRTFYCLNVDGSISDPSNIDGSIIDRSNIDADGSITDPYGSNSDRLMGQPLTPNKEGNKEENKERNREVSMRTSGNSSAIAAVASAQAQTLPTSFPQSSNSQNHSETKPAGKDSLPNASERSVAAHRDRPDTSDEQTRQNDAGCSHNASTFISGVCPENEPPPMSDEDLENLFADAQLEERSAFPGKGAPPFSEKEEKGTHPSEQRTERPKKKRTSIARPDGVSEQVWNDFSALRTKRRAPITETALKGIQREAEKAGITLEEALSTCCERGWQGFKAEWYRREKLEQKNASKAEYQLPSNDDWDNFDTAHYA